MSEEFDVLVVGGGSGLTATYHAEADGKRIALVEDGPLGGTCVNRGCIPTKTLIRSAELVRSIRDGARFGVRVDDKAVDIDFQAIMGRMRDMREANVAHSDEWVEGSEHITLFRDRGTFVDDRTMAVGGREVQAEHVFIAAGASPLVPPIDGIDDVPFLTNREVLNDMTELPDRLAILGGGYIGLEFANFFSALGTEVTVVESRSCLLREDPDVREVVTQAVSEYTTLHNGARATAVRRDGDGIVLTVSKDGDEPFEVVSDELLVATGRTPNTGGLGLDATGVETDEHGWITVDDHLRTSHPQIYAYGDVIGQAMFKHTSSFEGEVAYRNSQGADRVMDYRANPHAIFTHPEIGSVGLREDEARELGLDFRVAKTGYDSTAKGEIVGAHERDFAKVIVENGTDRILGAHIVGPQAADLVHEVVVAMNSGDGTVENITRSIHVHPTLPELVHTVFSRV